MTAGEKSAEVKKDEPTLPDLGKKPAEKDPGLPDLGDKDNKLVEKEPEPPKVLKVPPLPTGFKPEEKDPVLPDLGDKKKVDEKSSSGEKPVDLPKIPPLPIGGIKWIETPDRPLPKRDVRPDGGRHGRDDRNNQPPRGRDDDRRDDSFGEKSPKTVRPFQQDERPARPEKPVEGKSGCVDTCDVPGWVFPALCAVGVLLAVIGLTFLW
ncbi:MAG: hypothetical protein WCT18_04260 [Patescibacteria group bacterium]